MTKIITSIYRVHDQDTNLHLVHDQDTNLHLVDDQDTNLHENITKILTSISYMTRRPASNLRTCPAVQLQVESTQGTAVVHRVIQISRTIQDTVVYMQGDTNI